MCVCVCVCVCVCITRPASNEIFSPSHKIHREVGRAKDLSAPLYLHDETVPYRGRSESSSAPLWPIQVSKYQCSNVQWRHSTIDDGTTTLCRNVGHITKRRDATSQKKECLKCTAAKADNLLAGMPWPCVKSRCHGRSDRRDLFGSSRCCWHVCRTCIPQASERWCCDVTVVW